MSTAKTPPGKEPGSLQTTRQMLDELDALMDRMLALPVNDLDESPPHPPRDIVRMPAMSATLTVLEPPVEEEPSAERAPSVETVADDLPVEKRYVVEEYVEERHAEQPVQEEDEEEEKGPEAPPALLLQESFPSYRPTFEAPPKASPPKASPPKAPPRIQRQADSIDPDPIPEEMIPPSITRLPAPVPPPAPAVKRLRLPRRSLASLSLVPLVWLNQSFDVGTVLLGPVGRGLRGQRGRHFLGMTGLALLAATGLWLVKDWLGWTW